MGYDSHSPKAAKFLLADGSISGSMPVSTDAAQVTSTTPEYDQYAPMASKWLLPDGTVTDKLPISGDLGGGGDMTKAEYDTDQDGKVDLAETADSAPWGGITGKPSTFPPSAHTHATTVTPIADPTTATVEDVANKINELIAALQG